MSSTVKRFYFFLTALILLFFTNSLFSTYSRDSAAPIRHDHVRWTVLDVSDENSQADANLLEFGNGEVVLIDAGETSHHLIPQLQKLKIRRINKVVISHPHKDHYNGVYSLIASSIIIDELYLNLPPRDICDSEIPWGCDFGDLERLIVASNRKNILIKKATTGDTLVRFGNLHLNVLIAHDGVSAPVGATDINDLSLIMSLKNDSTRALFTGDLNNKLGSFLALNMPIDLKAQLLKVPHHGADSLAPNSFFEAVSPLEAFVPSPDSLWLSDRSKRARTWFNSRGLHPMVTGHVGAVRIELFPNSYQIIELGKSLKNPL